MVSPMHSMRQMGAVVQSEDAGALTKVPAEIMAQDV